MRLPLAALPLALGACFTDVPDLGASASEGTTTAATAAASTAATSSGASSEATADTTSTSGTSTTSTTSGTTAASTTDAASSTTAATTAATTDATDASTSSTGTTAAPEPFTLDLEATLASCAILANLKGPYAGAGACESHLVKVHGVAPGSMAVDLSLTADQTNRPIRTFLRFDPPLDLGGAVVDAQLRLVVEGAAASGGLDSGDLHAAEPFDAASLQSDAPAALALITPDPGPADPGQAVTWPLPPALVGAGKPLHLALLPLTDDGVIYRSSAAIEVALRPRLVLTIQP